MGTIEADNLTALLVLGDQSVGAMLSLVHMGDHVPRGRAAQLRRMKAPPKRHGIQQPTLDRLSEAVARLEAELGFYRTLTQMIQKRVDTTEAATRVVTEVTTRKQLAHIVCAGAMCFDSIHTLCTGGGGLKTMKSDVLRELTAAGLDPALAESALKDAMDEKETTGPSMRAAMASMSLPAEYGWCSELETKSNFTFAWRFGLSHRLYGLIRTSMGEQQRDAVRAYYQRVSQHALFSKMAPALQGAVHQAIYVLGFGFHMPNCVDLTSMILVMRQTFDPTVASAEDAIGVSHRGACLFKAGRWNRITALAYNSGQLAAHLIDGPKRLPADAKAEADSWLAFQKLKLGELGVPHASTEMIMSLLANRPPTRLLSMSYLDKMAWDFGTVAYRLEQQWARDLRWDIDARSNVIIRMITTSKMAPFLSSGVREFLVLAADPSPESMSLDLATLLRIVMQHKTFCAPE